MEPETVLMLQAELRHYIADLVAAFAENEPPFETVAHNCEDLRLLAAAIRKHPFVWPPVDEVT